MKNLIKNYYKIPEANKDIIYKALEKTKEKSYFFINFLLFFTLIFSIFFIKSNFIFFFSNIINFLDGNIILISLSLFMWTIIFIKNYIFLILLMSIIFFTIFIIGTIINSKLDFLQK